MMRGGGATAVGGGAMVRGEATASGAGAGVEGAVIAREKPRPGVTVSAFGVARGATLKFGAPGAGPVIGVESASGRRVAGFNTRGSPAGVADRATGGVVCGVRTREAVSEVEPIPGGEGGGAGIEVIGGGVEAIGRGAPVVGATTVVLGRGAPVVGDGVEIEGEGKPAVGRESDVTGAGVDVDGGGAPVVGDGVEIIGPGAPRVGAGMLAIGEGVVVLGAGNPVTRRPPEVTT